jgi:hypothetical protein
MGNAVTFVTAAYLDLSDISSSATCRTFHGWAGLQVHGHIIETDGERAYVDYSTAAGSSGSPVFDSNDTLCGLVSGGHQLSVGKRYDTNVTLFGTAADTRLIHDAETTAAAEWARARVQRQTGGAP